MGRAGGVCAERREHQRLFFLWECTSKHLCALVLHKAERVSQDASVAVVTIRNSSTYIQTTDTPQHTPFADSCWRPCMFLRGALSFTPYLQSPPGAAGISCVYNASFPYEMLSENCHQFNSKSES